MSFPANAHRVTHKVVYEGGRIRKDALGKRVCVIDSSVHSGSTMAAIVRSVSKHDPASVTSYSLIMKRSAVFIPSLWGVTINDHDRAYFLLPELPNNRLSKARHQTHLRLLERADISAPPVVSGRDSMDRITWADRYYDSICSERERRTYLLEDGARVVGYLTVARVGHSTLRLDEVAVSKDLQGNGYASTLLRWAETCARQQKCETLELWGIEDKAEVYEGKGYKRLGAAMDLDGEKYFRMQKRLIHHLKPMTESEEQYR